MTIYLYVKTHNQTGLKYLGQTSSKDPHKYPGSGVYWKLHLEKHGYDYTTEILKECSTKNEICEYGIYYSKLWNIVESDDWANLKVEQGDGGRQNEEVRKRIGEKSKGRIPWNKGKSVWTDEQRRQIGGRNKLRGPQSLETIKKRIENNLGKTRSVEQKKRMSISQKGRTISSEHAEKISNANKGRTPWNKGKNTLCKTTAKTWKIINLETNDIYTIFSLREWCKLNQINYQVFHRNIQKEKPYKNYRAFKI